MELFSLAKFASISAARMNVRDGMLVPAEHRHDMSLILYLSRSGQKRVCLFETGSIVPDVDFSIDGVKMEIVMRRNEAKGIYNVVRFFKSDTNSVLLYCYLETSSVRADNNFFESWRSFEADDNSLVSELHHPGPRSVFAKLRPPRAELDGQLHEMLAEMGLPEELLEHIASQLGGDLSDAPLEDVLGNIRAAARAGRIRVRRGHRGRPGGPPGLPLLRPPQRRRRSSTESRDSDGFDNPFLRLLAQHGDGEGDDEDDSANAMPIFGGFPGASSDSPISALMSQMAGAMFGGRHMPGGPSFAQTFGQLIRGGGLDSGHYRILVRHLPEGDTVEQTLSSPGFQETVREVDSLISENVPASLLIDGLPQSAVYAQIYDTLQQDANQEEPGEGDSTGNEGAASDQQGDDQDARQSADPQGEE